MGNLVCPNCGSLVYAQRLNELANQAVRIEQANPLGAAGIWREMLGLLPPDSRQYQEVQQRIGMLTSGFGAAGTLQHQGQMPGVTRRNDPLPVALAKTFVSMLISILVYAWFFAPHRAGESSGIFKGPPSPEQYVVGLLFASVFVLLILVHELGHVIAMHFYGLKAGPPIFIPFLGALINMRERPKDALQEAVVGIGGPILGTVGALVCYGIYLKTGWEVLIQMCALGFMINLFNMLPVPPLDGGRITAAVSPWIWLPGLLGLAGLVVLNWLTGGGVSFIAILILLYAWPRVKQTLIGRERDNAYYKIGLPAMWGMGAAYVGLGLFLAYFVYRTGTESGLLRMFR
jgi:Zn-dependent protease